MPGAEKGEWKHVSDPAEQIQIRFNHNPLLKAVLRAIFYEGLHYIWGITRADAKRSVKARGGKG